MRIQIPSIPIDDFIERFIDGDSIGDLKAMLNVPTPSPGGYGASGFSIVLVTLAGIGVLGFLVGDSTNAPRQGRQNFKRFWSTFMYNGDAERNAVADSIYGLVRNGLAHGFLTKPGIVTSTQREGTRNHLCRLDGGGLQIDACVPCGGL